MTGDTGRPLRGTAPHGPALPRPSPSACRIPPYATADRAEARLRRHGRAGRAAFYRQIAQADQRFTDEIQGLYPEITVPVTVCWGEQDTWIPVAKAHELAALVPGARLRLIPDAGHLVPLDAPALLLAELVGFLTAAG